MAAPPARRTLLLLALALALALLLGVGAALSSRASHPTVSSASRSSASRDAPRPGSAARLQGTPVSVLGGLASPVRLRIVALAVAPARRRLLAVPAEYLEEAHGGAAAAPAAAPEGADAGHEVPLAARVTSTAADAAEIVDNAGPLSASRPQPGAAALLQTTPASIIAQPASPVRRHVAALPAEPSGMHLLGDPAESPGPHEEDDPAASPAPAAQPVGADAAREVPVPTRATTCSFVTYIGVDGNAVDAIQRGDDRVFVVREFARATNGSEATIGYGLESPSDDDTDDEDDVTDGGDSDEDAFDRYMAWFCTYVAYLSDILDVLEAFE